MRPARTETAWLDALYRETSADLLAFLRRRCRTPEDAADCLAETYLVAWRKQPEHPTEAELRPWLFGIARNLASRSHQHNGRLAAATKALAESLSAAATTTNDDGATDAAHGPLHDALTQLSNLDREIITMISWDDLKPGEVATILGISANVVRVRAHRAKARLREQLASQAQATYQP